MLMLVRPGCRVVIDGLKSRLDLNGTMAKVYFMLRNVVAMLYDATPARISG